MKFYLKYIFFIIITIFLYIDSSFCAASYNIICLSPSSQLSVKQFVTQLEKNYKENRNIGYVFENVDARISTSKKYILSKENNRGIAFVRSVLHLDIVLLMKEFKEKYKEEYTEIQNQLLFAENNTIFENYLEIFGNLYFGNNYTKRLINKYIEHDISYIIEIFKFNHDLYLAKKNVNFNIGNEHIFDMEFFKDKVIFKMMAFTYELKFLESLENLLNHKVILDPNERTFLKNMHLFLDKNLILKDFLYKNNNLMNIKDLQKAPTQNFVPYNIEDETKLDKLKRLVKKYQNEEVSIIKKNFSSQIKKMIKPFIKNRTVDKYLFKACYLFRKDLLQICIDIFIKDEPSFYMENDFPNWVLPPPIIKLIKKFISSYRKFVPVTYSLISSIQACIYLKSKYKNPLIISIGSKGYYSAAIFEFLGCDVKLVEIHQDINKGYRFKWIDEIDENTFKGKDIIILDNDINTGWTLKYLLNKLSKYKNNIKAVYFNLGMDSFSAFSKKEFKGKDFINSEEMKNIEVLDPTRLDYSNLIENLEELIGKLNKHSNDPLVNDSNSSKVVLTKA